MSISSPVLDLSDLCRITQKNRHGQVSLRLHAPKVGHKTELMDGTYSGLEPIPVEILEGGRVDDLVGTGYAGLHLVTSRFRDALITNNLTGWILKPTTMSGSRLREELWLLSVVGRSGPVYTVGGKWLSHLDPMGQYIDPEEWDGSDFFMGTVEDFRRPELVPAGGPSLLTGRAARILAEAKLSNVGFEQVWYEPLPRLDWC